MDKPVIGLTGPTGAGKSTVAAAFRKQGCVIVDADKAARGVADRPECLAKLENAFGSDILAADGRLNRHALAGLAFASPEETEKLNGIMHPAIFTECSQRLAAACASDCRAVILDAPLLFESGAERLCTATVAVITPDVSRMKRIMARDGITEDEAKARMAVQHGNDYYRNRADYLFDGSTDWSVFDEVTGALLDRILREVHEKT